MIKVQDGFVYETLDVVTPNQTAVVTTFVCAEHKLVMSAVDNFIMIEYKDWQDIPVDSSAEVTLRIIDTLTNTASKIKIALYAGFATYELTGSGDYQISASTAGADGASIYVEVD